MGGLLEAPARRRPWWASIVPVPAPVLAAAAILVVALGVWTWRSAGGPPQRSRDLPPSPDRVVVLEPGVDWQSSQGAAPGDAGPAGAR
jgi:hypothetical protein